MTIKARYEISLERKMRQLSFLIPFITIATGLALFIGILFCAYYFEQGHFWTFLPAGLIGHAFFIVIVHDGAHKSITRSKLDRYIMNLGCAVMLLPFYGEGFRKYHLIHHANTNSNIDPLWPSKKKKLYENYRWLYILCELVPLLYTGFLVFTQKKQTSEVTQRTKSPRINYYHIIWGSVLSISLILWLQPPVYFLIATLLTLNIFSTLRHWCEHLGYDRTKTSNTFWFPLGMGIGNHDTHHEHPHVSWVVLFIGLFKRKKDTRLLRTVFGVFFKKSFHHYEGH
jgi:fatty acid desaturase